MQDRWWCKGARSCSKQAEDATKMSLFLPPPSSRLASAAVADSFDSSTASPVPVKVENEANAPLPDRATWNKVSIQGFFSPLLLTSRGVCCEKRLRKAKWCRVRFVFPPDHLKPRRGHGVPISIFFFVSPCHTFKGIKTQLRLWLIGASLPSPEPVKMKKEKKTKRF